MKKVIIRGAIIGVVVAQAMFWLPKLAKATAIEDGGAIIAADVLCQYHIPRINFTQQIVAAMQETGIRHEGIVKGLIRDKGATTMAVLINTGTVKEFCSNTLRFFRERNIRITTAQ